MFPIERKPLIFLSIKYVCDHNVDICICRKSLKSLTEVLENTRTLYYGEKSSYRLIRVIRLPRLATKETSAIARTGKDNPLT